MDTINLSQWKRAFYSDKTFCSSNTDLQYHYMLLFIYLCYYVCCLGWLCNIMSRRKHSELVGELSNLYHKEQKLLAEVCMPVCFSSTVQCWFGCFYDCILAVWIQIWLDQLLRSIALSISMSISCMCLCEWTCLHLSWSVLKLILLSTTSAVPS